MPLIHISDADVALLSEAHAYAQFSDINLPQTTKSALYRVLDGIQIADSKSQWKPLEDNPESS